MPENQTPATQPESGAAPAEFNFDKQATDHPRMKRRSLKAKPEGLIKPSAATPAAARELEREAPPLSAEQAQPAKSQTPVVAKVLPPAKAAQAPVAAPPRATPSPATTTSQPASAGATPAPKPAAASTPTASPHGTRPAALYYSSYPRKEKAAPSPMKTTPLASPASSSSAASTGTLPPPAARTATSLPRPAANVDYRANVERQSREQKSVGNILSYVVYALIAFFVISAGLAVYGADVIFKQLHDQSTTVSDLDSRYSAANKDLNAKLATTQESLADAQAQLSREQDLILKQQEEFNRMIVTMNDNITALKAEKQSRMQETASLRARVRDLENRGTFTQKY